MCIPRVNGYTQETTIDDMGQITKILAPNEQVIAAPYTIQIAFIYSYECSTATEADKQRDATLFAHLLFDFPNKYKYTDEFRIEYQDSVYNEVQKEKERLINISD